jgi:hypothetical protein
MYEYTLIETICNKLNIETNIKNVTLVDQIIFNNNFDKITNVLREYESSLNIEKYIIDINLNKYSRLINIISNNYYQNDLKLIYVKILGNPLLIDTLNFKILHKNYNIFKLIVSNIKKSYDYILNDNELYKFYNYHMINLWYNTILQKPILKNSYYDISKETIENKNKTWKHYKFIWNKYEKAVLEVKEYLNIARNFYKNKKIEIVGCYNIDKNLYKHWIETHLGFKIDLKKLYKWSKFELKRLVIEMKNTLQLIDPTIDMTKSHTKIIEDIGKNQKYKTKEEFVDHYKTIIKKYEDIYINKYGFKQFDKLNIIILNMKYNTNGDQTDNNIFINVSNWKYSNKYMAESLMLHESIPGHYLQQNSIKYLKQDNNLLFKYYFNIVDGFYEGWGLFSEKLGIKQNNWDKIGRIEYEMLRTLRIIASIKIHVIGYTPKQIYKYMKQYLLLPENELNAEIYRYVCRTQVLTYKIGSHIFEIILRKKNIIDILSKEAIIIYKEIINDGPIPLKFLMEKYNIQENELF